MQAWLPPLPIRPTLNPPPNASRQWRETTNKGAHFVSPFPMKRLRGVSVRRVFLLLIMFLGGCAQGAVQFAPTPLPPDVSPLRFEHPSGAFSISVPRDWSAYVQNTGALASASFAPPDSDSPLLTVAVVSLSAPLDLPTLAAQVEAYQTLHRPDLRDYREQSRSALGDGSWLMAGVRMPPGSDPVPLNTFIESRGTLLAVSEVILPSDAVRRTELQTALNTLTLTPETSALVPSDVAHLGLVRTQRLEVLNTRAWTNDIGVLFVTGEVRNNTDTTLTRIPVTVTLYDARGNVLLEASDVVMGHGVVPGGFAPFSLRFGEGQPSDATRFVVRLGAGEPLPEDTTLYGADALAWEQESTFTAENHLLVTGTLTNTRDFPIGQIIAHVTVFDGQGRVIGAWFSPIQDAPLAGGQSVPFEVRVLELDSAPTNYILEIQGLG